MFVCLLLLLLLLPVLLVLLLLLREWSLPLHLFSSPLPPSLLESETDGTLLLTVSIVADVDVDVDGEPTTRRSAARFIVLFCFALFCLGVFGVCWFGLVWFVFQLSLCVGKWCIVLRTSVCKFCWSIISTMVITSITTGTKTIVIAIASTFTTEVRE